jgi:hypothetical protein
MTNPTIDLRAHPDTPLALNMTLLAHHELDGHGGLGEGMSIQLCRDGRRIIWLAHEGAPKNFSGVDVSDPRAPKLVVQTELPGLRMRSNSLEIVGDILAVAYQTEATHAPEAGFELFDVGVPETPRSIGFFSCAGEHSRGVHQLWFVDGETVHLSSGAPDFVPAHPMDDQIYRIVDVRNPAKAQEIGRWWLPGTREGDAAPAPFRDRPGPHFHYRAHNTNVYPERPDRCYLGYLDGGAIVLDISDTAHPKQVGRWDNSPPYPGFTHTVLPLFSRDLLIVTDESIKDGGADWPKLAWVLDNRVEANPIPISTLPVPPVEVFGRRGGRYGAHNLHENHPGPASFRSDSIVVGSFFNGGVRVFDLADPYRPEEVAYYVPAAPRLSPAGAIQINDVFVDERGIVYAADRLGGGLYIVEMTL